MQHDELAEVEALERRLLDPRIRSSRRILDEMIADDFFEIGRSGRIWTKDEILEAFPNEPVLDIEIDSVQSRRIGADVILVTYRSKRMGDGDSAAALRSSIWRRAEKKWKVTFHQGTPATGQQSEPPGAVADPRDSQKPSR